MLLKAVIFDLDGTVIDNEWVYDRAFCEVLKARGISCAELNHIPGIGLQENWEKMAAKLALEEDPAALAEQTRQAYLRRLKEIKVRDGARPFILHLRGKGLKTILATSTVRELAEQVLESARLKPLFDARVSGDEVLQKKPAPDIFLKALDRLKLLPKEALVIEDSPAGIQAAKAARMKVIALKTDWFTRSQLSRADLILDSFAQILEKFRHNHFIETP